MFRRAERNGVWTIQSSIFPENGATVALHGQFGFRVIGRRERIALMTYGPTTDQYALLTARYVDRILRGANPGDLPVEQPSRFELAINLKTAQAIGLTLPDALLQRADRIIR